MTREGDKLMNFSTEVSVEKTIMEIERYLQYAGATAVLKEMNATGVTGISFSKKTDRGELMFRLPMNTQAMLALLNEEVNQGKIPRRYKDNIEQARRVGWRIIKDWVASQLAYTRTKMVKFEQVFLPYAVGKDGKTIFEILNDMKFSPLMLDAHPETQED